MKSIAAQMLYGSQFFTKFPLRVLRFSSLLLKQFPQIEIRCGQSVTKARDAYF